MSSLERAIIAQQADEVPHHRNQQWETDSSASESETFIADGEEETFEHRGNEAKEEMEDVDAAERDDTVSVADRIQNIASALTYSATAAGSVEATSHHADE